MPHIKLNTQSPSLTHAAFVAAVLGLSASATAAQAQTIPEGADPALHERVPAEYKDGISTVYDPQYPPSYFIDEDNTVAGYVIDLQNAIGTKLGVPIKLESAKFAGIVAGIQGKRYDASYFHDSAERREIMEIVAMQQTGTAVLVKKGNPANLDLHDLCGRKIGVANGSTQALDVLPRLQEECAKAGEPEIESFTFAGPNEGSLAVQTGRVDGWLDGAPYAGYVVMQNPDAFEKTPTADLTGRSGFAFRKDDPMAELFRDAAKAIIADGTYQKILDHWRIPELALATPLINGN